MTKPKQEKLPPSDITLVRFFSAKNKSKEIRMAMMVIAGDHKHWAPMSPADISVMLSNILKTILTLGDEYSVPAFEAARGILAHDILAKIIAEEDTS